MRIGIDAKWYFEGNPSGKRVVRNLVNYIAKIATENEYVIFLSKKNQKEVFPFQAKNIEVCYVWSGVNAVSNVFILPYYSKKYKIDVMLYQTFISPFDKAKKVAYMHGISFHSHQQYFTFPERLYFLPLRFITQFSDAIITVSNEEKNKLLMYRYSEHPDRITVAYHGVEPDFKPLDRHRKEVVEAIKQKYNLPDKFLLFVGRITPTKNLETLLRAIPLLQEKKVPLVVVGATDSKKSNHLEVIKELSLEEGIHFTGAVNQDLEVIYALATVFCFPSFYESFGMPPVEAMASGVPVVVSNTTALPEICGDAAIYVSPESPNEIANAIDELLVNDNLYQQKRSLGLNRAKEFTWEKTTQAVLDCLTSC